MSAPLALPFHALTAVFLFDRMHRRAGGEAVPGPKVSKHADSHKYCPLGSCGNRPRPYAGGYQMGFESRQKKITAWRKTKARANRAYLEEHVYGKTKVTLG